MTHARPLPEAATPPYPPHPAPRPVTDDKPAAKAADQAGDAKTGKWIAAGAAIGVGSAAIVAAALYAGRSRSKK